MDVNPSKTFNEEETSFNLNVIKELSPFPNYTNFDPTANNYFNRRMALNRRNKEERIQKHGHTTYYNSRSYFQREGMHCNFFKTFGK